MGQHYKCCHESGLSQVNIHPDFTLDVVRIEKPKQTKRHVESYILVHVEFQFGKGGRGMNTA